jgi:hypothetical protein
MQSAKANKAVSSGHDGDSEPTANGPAFLAKCRTAAGAARVRVA